MGIVSVFKIQKDKASAVKLHCEYTQVSVSFFIRGLLVRYLKERGVIDPYNKIVGEWGEPVPVRKSKNGEKAISRNFGDDRKWRWDGSKIEEPKSIGLSLQDGGDFPLYNVAVNWVMKGQDGNAPSLTSLFRYLIEQEMYLLGYYNKKGVETAKLRELSDNLQRVAA